MSSAKALLLPLYYIKKQARTRFLSEKGLIFLIVFTSIFSLVVIFTNLPTSSQHDEGIQNAFLVKLYQNNSHLIHKNDISHQRVHHRNGPKIDDNYFKNIEKAILMNEKKNLEDDMIEAPVEDERKINVRVLNPVQEKQDFIKKMTLHAWNGYKKYAWGSNELKPLSKVGHSAGIFGGAGANNLGATIVDALDTLYLMGFKEEFELGTDWILKNLNLDHNAEYSAFEVNIRFIGGLLSLHALTGEKAFITKAQEIADLFLPVFDSPTGIPYSLFNPKTGYKRNYNWAGGSCSILAEFGSLSLEFNYLSDLTGNPIYKKKVDKIFSVIQKVEDNGLYYNYLNPNSGTWCNTDATLGALADSFYEYLLKLWLYGGKKDDDLLEMFLKAMKAARTKLIGKTQGGLTFAGEYSRGRLAYKMGHLACFSGGMFALTAMKVDKLSDRERQTYKDLAIGITNTCHESYIKTATHIGPETFHFNPGNEAKASSDNEKYYILRPEVVEAYFYLWRMTKDNKYREWAWDAAQAIEKHCRTDNGYSGIRNVYDENPSKDDVQQSFFFAETLKYLYLIFSDDDAISFDKYVFNTEAHPFLIKKL